MYAFSIEQINKICWGRIFTKLDAQIKCLRSWAPPAAQVQASLPVSGWFPDSLLLNVCGPQTRE